MPGNMPGTIDLNDVATHEIPTPWKGSRIPLVEEGLSSANPGTPRGLQRSAGEWCFHLRRLEENPRSHAEFRTPRRHVMFFL